MLMFTTLGCSIVLMSQLRHMSVTTYALSRPTYGCLKPEVFYVSNYTSSRLENATDAVLVALFTTC